MKVKLLRDLKTVKALCACMLIFKSSTVTSGVLFIRSVAKYLRHFLFGEL